MEEGKKRRLTVAVTGLNTLDITMRSLARQTKIDLKTVPFGGVPAAMVAIMGGQVDAGALGGVFEFVRSGKVRVIARATDEPWGYTKKSRPLNSLEVSMQLHFRLQAFLGPKAYQIMSTKHWKKNSLALPMIPL